MTRLLAVGHGVQRTGYARAIESVLAPLAAGGAIEPVLFAVNERGARPARPYELRTNRLPGDRFGREQLPALLDELEPDVVLVHGDTPFYTVHSPVLERWRAERTGRAIAVWCPLDWGRIPSAIARALAGADLVAAYTQHGRAALERAFAAASAAPRRTTAIGHGVDRGRFHPLDRAAARTRAFGAGRLPAEAFVVLNANRNVARKRIDLTLRGFARFAHDRPAAFLCLHMAPLGGGADVLALAGELGIADRVIVASDGEAHPAVDDESLNAVYAACEVGLNTCEAEGWGLPSFEHASAGGAQVVPGAGACAELWRGAGLLVPATSTPLGGHLVDPEDVAVALGRLYDDRSLLAERAARARAHAGARRFDWTAIAEEWTEALTAVVR